DCTTETAITLSSPVCRSHGRSREALPRRLVWSVKLWGQSDSAFAGAVSALRHAHTTQDELIYILHGHPVLISDAGEMQLSPGMCAGFKAGTGNAHQLVNRTSEEVQYLEIGDRSPGDGVVYPDDDLQAVLVDGRWQFTHKDGSRY
ncbi:MAG TPA: cupin domain-containing protein, partial [Nodosilinea sp.]|nr:cupin domain-containing protein [Nodosilinea sp.]